MTILENRRPDTGSDAEASAARPRRNRPGAVLGAALAMVIGVSVATSAQTTGPVTFSKDFSPASIGVGGTSVLTFTITNNNEIPYSGLAFDDAFPSGVVVADPTGAADTCGGSLTAVAGGGTITYVGGMIDSGFPAICTVSVNVTSATPGVHLNTSSQLTSSGQQPGQHGTASATLTVTAGTITIVKDAMPNDPQDFVFTGSGSIGTFSLDDDADGTLPSMQSFVVAPGVYSVSESPLPPGWSLGGTSCTGGSTVTAIDVSAGETVTCTFTNTQNPGTITIVKDAIPDDAQDFAFTGSGSIGAFSLDDDADGTLPSMQSFSVAPGVYSVDESPLPPGWSLGGTSCTDESPVTAIDVSADETVTCTFTNSFTPTTLQVTKTDSVDPVTPGGALVYTVTVTNAGASTATAVVLTESYPPLFTFTSAVPAPSVDTTGFSLGDLGPGDFSTVTINGTVSASATNGAVLANMVTASATGVTPAATTENTAVVAPVLEVAPSTTQFGDVEVGNTVCNPVTIRNIGGADLNVSAVAITGEDANQFANQGFSGSAPPFTLTPSATNIMTVCFTPTSMGLKTADIDVTSNTQAPSASANAIVAGLQGNGVAAVPTLPQWGLILLTLVLAAYGASRLRRRVGDPL